MTKTERTEDLIDLGAASVETRGSVPINTPDDQNQYLRKPGLAVD